MRKELWITAGVTAAVLIAALLFQNIELSQANVVYHQHREQPSEAELGFCAVCGGEAALCTHLPIIEVNTGGQKIPGAAYEPEDGSGTAYETGENGETEIRVQFRTIEETGQRHHVTDAATVSGTALFRVRGHSSRWFSKHNYRLKIVNSSDPADKQKLALMGMNAGSEWSLHGPFLDKTLMRNYMWMNLSAEIMSGYVPQVRFCELILDGEYQGVYVLMEMITVQEGRLNLKKYRAGDPVFSYLVRIEPEITDEKWIENFSFYTYRMEEDRRLELVYPTLKDQTEQVRQYVQIDFSEIERELFAQENQTGSHAWKDRIDLDSFADYYIIEEFLAINDAFSASTYFYRNARGKLCVGPVWDFNNVLDNFFQPMPDDALILDRRGWYGQMMRDEEFVELVIRRYRQLRKGVLSDENLLAYAREVRDWLGSAIERNDALWGYAYDPELLTWHERRSPEIGGALEDVNPESYSEAFDWMCDYMVTRGQWMDEHIDTLRQYCHPSRYAGQTVE